MLKSGSAIVAAGVVLAAGLMSASAASQQPAQPALRVEPAAAAPAPLPPPPSGRGYVGSQACQRCHAPCTTAGRKRAWRTSLPIRRRTPSAVLPDFSKPGSAAHLQARRRGVRVRDEMEAALLHEAGQRLFPARRRSGTSRTRCGAPYFVAAEHRLVGAALSRRQQERPDRPAVRRLPLGELQRADEDASPSGTSAASGATAAAASTSRSPTATNIVNPAKLDFVRGQRHVHPVPLAGAAARPIRSTASTTTGRSAFTQGGNLKDLLEARGAQARRDDVHAFRRRHGAQEPDAGERLRAERDVPPRRHLLQLPRRRTARGNNADSIKPARELCLDVPRARLAERPARRATLEAAHASRGRQRRQRVRRVPHAENRADDRRRQRPQPHVCVHHAEHDRLAEGPEPVRHVPHGQEHEVGAGCACDMDQHVALAGPMKLKVKGRR